MSDEMEEDIEGQLEKAGEYIPNAGVIREFLHSTPLPTKKKAESDEPDIFEPFYDKMVQRSNLTDVDILNIDDMIDLVDIYDRMGATRNRDKWLAKAKSYVTTRGARHGWLTQHLLPALPVLQQQKKSRRRFI